MPWAAEWENCAADTGEQLWVARVEASQRIMGARGCPSLRFVLAHMIEE